VESTVNWPDRRYAGAEQATAESKEHVLGRAIRLRDQLRERLGESALKRYTAGNSDRTGHLRYSLEEALAVLVVDHTMLSQGNYTAAVPLPQRAIMGPNGPSLMRHWNHLPQFGERELAARTTRRRTSYGRKVSEREVLHRSQRSKCVG